jgi:hypothetical protein
LGPLSVQKVADPVDSLRAEKANQTGPSDRLDAGFANCISDRIAVEGLARLLLDLVSDLTCAENRHDRSFQ